VYADTGWAAHSTGFLSPESPHCFSLLWDAPYFPNTPLPHDPFTLSTGRVVDLHGLKLLEVLQLDTGAHAPLVECISDMTATEFYALAAPAGFPAPSKTPTP
jgi:hypothetical protein